MLWILATVWSWGGEPERSTLPFDGLDRLARALPTIALAGGDEVDVTDHALFAVLEYRRLGYLEAPSIAPILFLVFDSAPPLAVVREPAGARPKVMGVGDALLDGRTVASISGGAVTLSDGVVLFDPSGLHPTPGVTVVGPNQFQVKASVLRSFLDEPADSKLLARSLLHRGSDGEFDGYWLSALRPNTPLSALGIASGDVIHEIAGVKLVTVDAMVEAWRVVQTVDHACVDLDRRNEPMHLCYQVVP